MRAIVISRPGGPEVLELREVPDPVPARGEVRVRVHATAVNRADLLQRAGHYPAPPDAPPDIPGLEYAGEIDACGEGVLESEGKPGDRVFGLAGGGTYADKVVVHVRTLAHIPDRLTFSEAAATPEAFITAYDALVTQAGLGSGDRVLIHAVGSGVGTAAVQITRLVGARALGTARDPDKLIRARKLGLGDGILVDGPDGHFAGQVLALTGGDSGAEPGVDVILELVGGAYLAEDLVCTAPRARIVVVGLLAGRRVDLDLGTLLQKRLIIRGTTLRLRPLEEKIQATQEFRRHIVPHLASGALVPVVGRTFDLTQAAQAHEYVASNAGFGKVVLGVA